MSEIKTSQNNNEYIVEYFDFPEKLKAQFIGQLFQHEDARKKFTTPVVNRMFSIMEQMGVEELKEVNGQPVVVFAKSEFSKKLRDVLGEKFVIRVVFEVVALLKYMNIKTFKRNESNIAVKKTFIKTEKALLDHLNTSLKK